MLSCKSGFVGNGKSGAFTSSQKVIVGLIGAVICLTSLFVSFTLGFVINVVLQEVGHHHPYAPTTKKELENIGMVVGGMVDGC